MTTLKRIFLKDDINTINNILNEFRNKYKLFKGVREGVVISGNYDHDDIFTGPKDKTNAYSRVDTILQHRDEFEKYLDEHPTKNYDKETILNLLEYIQYKYKPKEIDENETLKTQIKQTEEKKEELTQERDQARQAFKDSKDIQHQRFAEQSNNIKDLQNKLELYEQRFKELKKAPLKRNYINDKVFNESYSLDKGELMNVIKNDIKNHELPDDTDPEEIADAIYAAATKRIYKNLKRINDITVLVGYNADLYNKLPAEIAEIVKKHMNDKIQEDIRKKNIRYILPKEKPRWEKAIQKYNLNPMLGRGAYTI